MIPQSRIFVAGGNTLVGKALLSRLQDAGQKHLVGVPPHEPELTCQNEVDHFFAEAQPEYVFLTAGLSGGILANQNKPADLMLDNMLVSAHVLAAACHYGVKKLLYLGSSCMYPRATPQPLRPDMLQTGPLEPTNAAYATAKLAGMTLCQAYGRQHGAPFITGIPANAFGPHDDFSEDTGHVIPALIRRMHAAKLRGDKTLAIWGTGFPRREFIFASDLADACLFVMNHYDDDEPINLGSGDDISITEIAAVIAEVVDYRGQLRFDTSRPDGMPRKCLDSSKLFNLGWRPTTSLHKSLESTYNWFLHHNPSSRGVSTRTPRVPPPARRRCTRMYEPLYRSLYRIRRLEEHIALIYPSDKIKSPVHLSIGQEAVSVGVCAALEPRDVVFGTYRSHALYLAKGGDLRQMVAELFGKVTGCSRGKGGSMHLIDTDVGVMGTSAIVATTIANAVGYAYALKISRQNAIVVSFFGDGATEEGVWAESLNFAALKQLPILFVCENNKYAIHTHQSRRQGLPAICERARAHGVPGERIENNDVLEIFRRSQDTVQRLRSGQGPAFFEVMTYRWQEHVGPNQDFQLGYRTEEEARPWQENDQVRRLADLLQPSARKQIEADVEAEIIAAVEYAEISPYPEPEELYAHVFAEEAP